MKIKSILSIAPCLLLFVSCGSGSKTNSESTAADGVPADTVITDSVEMAEPAPVYVSDDLKKFGLKGSVIKVVHEFKDGWLPGFVDDDLAFNKEGKLTSQTPDLTLTVNSDGFISKVVDTMGATDGSTAINTFITLNEDGWPTKVKTEYDGPESNGYSDLTISYPDLDEHGNWTKCVIKGSQVYINIDTDAESKEPVNVTLVRKITY